MTSEKAPQNDLFQNVIAAEPIFMLYYPDHMVLLKEGDSVTITFRDTI